MDGVKTALGYITVLGQVLLFYPLGQKGDNAGCPEYQYLRNGKCVHCFTNARAERQKCRYLCDNGYPVKRCPDLCGYYCIDEWCEYFTNSCVKGCVKGRYGEACDRRCSEGCVKNGCDRDGKCQCKNGYHGAKCEKQCSKNCNKNRCNPHNLKCKEGCKTNWYGDTCDRRCSEGCKENGCDRDGKCQCKNGYYGAKCEKQCSKNCNEDRCYPDDGKCSEGCKTNWYGDTCTFKCPDNCNSGQCFNACARCYQHIPDICKTCLYGAYDSLCTESCKNCKGKGCHINGTCQGCDINLYISKCNQACRNFCKVPPTNTTSCSHINGACLYGCEQGSYGDFCENNCSRGCKSGLCDNRTGVCMEACHRTFYGAYCNKTCSAGCIGGVCNQITGLCTEGCNSTSYGPYCNHTCSLRCFGGECEVAENGTLTCKEGCVQGWRGSYCEDPSPENCTSCSNDSSICHQNCHYTPNKHNVCSEGCVGQDCDITGICRQGCVSGWMGRRCHFSTLWVILTGCLVLVILTVSAAVPLCKRYAVNRCHRKYDLSDKGHTRESMMLTVSDRADGLPLLKTDAYVDKSSVTTRVPVCQFQKYLDTQKQMRGLGKQFYRLPINPVYPSYEGDLSHSAMKNRYGDILPYDYNRVVLKKEPDGLSSDYINASYIEGYNRELSFIATQGPFTKVMKQFWQMIWQKAVSKIVMLTKCVENRKKKCDQYWPHLGHVQVITPDLVVECLTESIDIDVTIRTLVLMKKNHRSRAITHFHFTTWPDHDVPDRVTSLLNLHTAVMTSSTSTAGPVVVHCSAGVGRTGTFIALHNLIQQAKAEGIVDVFECVLRLRHQRLNMVQTEEQYVFLHEALLEATATLNDSPVTVDV